MNKELVEVKGPMGTGLEIQSTGVHIAWAAGTGILVFVDLVAHLILRIVGETGCPILGKKDCEQIDVKNF